jgi:hypothetical protein
LKGFPSASLARPFIKSRLSISLTPARLALEAEHFSQTLFTWGTKKALKQRLEMPVKMVAVLGASTVLWILFAVCKFLTYFTHLQLLVYYRALL